MTTPEASTDPLRASKRWLVATLATLALILLLNLIVVWRMDVFGILRDTRGRQLATGPHERRAKYLLNGAYVPENFDALIIGDSLSVNWRPADLTGYRFYDDSLEGGNATELRFAVQRTMGSGHFKVALVCVDANITQNHHIEDGLDTVKTAEAFGSMSSYGLMFNHISNRLFHTRSEFYADGSHEMGADFVHKGLPTHPPPGPKPGDPKSDTSIDTQAMADYRTLVQELQAKGVKVIYVTYPKWKPFYEYNRVSFEQYLSQALKTLPPAALIDLNDAEYTSFGSDPNNFIDNEHLSKQGSILVTALINAKMHQILRDR